MQMQIRQNYGNYANFGLRYRKLEPNVQIFLGLWPIFERGSEMRPNSEGGSETSPFPSTSMALNHEYNRSVHRISQKEIARINVEVIKSKNFVAAHR
jgi:hypothetical protein